MADEKTALAEKTGTKGHWIQFSAVIAAAIIAGLFSVYVATRKNNVGADSTFSYCVNVTEWSENGGNPVDSATVLIELEDFREKSNTDTSGCADFRIPVTLEGKRAKITVTTPKRTLTSVQDVRRPSTTVVIYPMTGQ